MCLKLLIASFFQQVEICFFVHLLLVVSVFEILDGIFFVVQFVRDIRSGDEAKIGALALGGKIVRQIDRNFRAEFFGNIFKGERLDSAGEVIDGRIVCAVETASIGMSCGFDWTDIRRDSRIYREDFSIFRQIRFTPLLLMIVTDAFSILHGRFFPVDEIEIENIFGDILRFVIVSRAGDQNESADAAQRNVRDGHHAVRFSGVENFVHGRVRVDLVDEIQKRIEFIELNIRAQMVAERVEQAAHFGNIENCSQRKSF